MNEQGVHVEFTMTGISRDILARAFEWVWEGVPPFFPIVTGAWGLFETALFTLAVIVAGLVALVIRYGLGNRDGAPSGATVIGAGVKDLQASSPSAAALSSERSTVALTATMAASSSLSFICRIGVSYVVISVLVCWIFGTGDLGIMSAFAVGS